jgi:hypothetical protein
MTINQKTGISSTAIWRISDRVWVSSNFHNKALNVLCP